MARLRDDLVHHFVPDRRNFNTGREEGQLCTIPNSSKCQLDVDDRALGICQLVCPFAFLSAVFVTVLARNIDPRAERVAFLVPENLVRQESFVMSKSFFRVNNVC